MLPLVAVLLPLSLILLLVVALGLFLVPPFSGGMIFKAVLAVGRRVAVVNALDLVVDVPVLNAGISPVVSGIGLGMGVV